MPSPNKPLPPHIVAYTPKSTSPASIGSSPSTPPRSGVSSPRSLTPPTPTGESNRVLGQAAAIGGYLMKRGFLNTAFKKRWCVLVHNRIMFYIGYYGEVRGSINVYQATIDESPQEELGCDNGSCAFVLVTPNDKHHKRWTLQALSPQEKMNWLLSIKKASSLADNDGNVNTNDSSMKLSPASKTLTKKKGWWWWK